MLDALIDDPIAVGQKLALVIQRGSQVRVNKIHAYGEVYPPIDMFDVDGSIEYYGSAQADQYGCLTVTIGDEPGEGKEPVYYLPWGEHQVYKVRLGSRRNPQPRLFFTDNLNGCAIVAEGITLMPNVYHANAMNTLASYSPVGDSSVMEPIALKVIDARNEAMFGACQAYPEDMSRSFLHSGKRWPLVEPAAAVTPREYAVLIGRPSEKAEVKAACTNPRLFKNVKVVPSFVGSRGAVFGVADGEGKWRFFVQKIVTLKGNRDVVLRCAEFWPGGFAARPW